MKAAIQESIAHLEREQQRIADSIELLQDMANVLPHVDEEAPAQESEQAQDECLQSAGIETAVRVRRQLPSTDLGNKFPPVRHGKRVSVLALEVVRQMPEPFKARDFARQAHISRASASQLLSKWHKREWLNCPAFGQWERTETFPDERK